MGEYLQVLRLLQKASRASAMGDDARPKSSKFFSLTCIVPGDVMAVSARHFSCYRRQSERPDLPRICSLTWSLMKFEIEELAPG